MNEGVAVVSARLSGDHLAHLIKHRGFNLVFRCARKTTFTSTYTSRSVHVHKQTCFWPKFFITHRRALFRFKLFLSFFFFSAAVHRHKFSSVFSDIPCKLPAADSEAPRVSEGAHLCARVCVFAPVPLIALSKSSGRLGSVAEADALLYSFESWILQVTLVLNGPELCTDSWQR